MGSERFFLFWWLISDAAGLYNKLSGVFYSACKYEIVMTTPQLLQMNYCSPSELSCSSLLIIASGTHG